jgi:hypothetical protein
MKKNEPAIRDKLSQLRTMLKKADDLKRSEERRVGKEC